MGGHLNLLVYLQHELTDPGCHSRKRPWRSNQARTSPTIQTEK